MINDRGHPGTGRLLLESSTTLHCTQLVQYVFRKLTSSQKSALLAYCVALTLRPALAPDADTEIAAYDTTLALTGVDVSDYWRPTADNYLSKITRDQLLALGSGIFGKTWGTRWATAKNGDLVKELAGAFADPKKYAANKDV